MKKQPALGFRSAGCFLIARLPGFNGIHGVAPPYPRRDGLRHRIPRQIQKSSLHLNTSEVQAAFSLPRKHRLPHGQRRCHAQAHGQPDGRGLVRQFQQEHQRSQRHVLRQAQKDRRADKRRQAQRHGRKHQIPAPRADKRRQSAQHHRRRDAAAVCACHAGQQHRQPFGCQQAESSLRRELV